MVDGQKIERIYPFVSASFFRGLYSTNKGRTFLNGDKQYSSYVCEVYLNIVV